MSHNNKNTTRPHVWMHVDVEGADVIGPVVEHRIHVDVLDGRQVVEPLVAAGVVRVDDPHSRRCHTHRDGLVLAAFAAEHRLAAVLRNGGDRTWTLTAGP